jgi:hypothetical protein
MIREEVSVATAGRPEVKFSYNFSENITEAIQMFDRQDQNEQNVHELFKRALTINAQAAARKMLSAGFTAERIQMEMDNWKPGVSLSTRASTKTVDAAKVIAENFDDWTPERQEEIYRLIQERFAKRGQAAPVAAENGSSEPTEEEIAAVTAGVNGGESAPEPTPAEQAAEGRRRNR